MIAVEGRRKTVIAVEGRRKTVVAVEGRRKTVIAVEGLECSCRRMVWAGTGGELQTIGRSALVRLARIRIRIRIRVRVRYSFWVRVGVRALQAGLNTTLACAHPVLIHTSHRM